MSRLEFLSPHAADVPPVSPIAHVPAIGFTDVSALGKLEVRGGIPSGAIPIGPDRCLLVLDGDVRAQRDQLTAAGYRVYDQTAALAGLEVEGQQLLRRLTDLDPETLPAIGAVARGIPALVERLEGDRFRLFVPQELAQFVAEVVNDQAEGLAP